MRTPTLRLAVAMSLLAFMVMFLSSGLKGLYQVYFTDLAASFAVSRGTFALAGAIFMLVMGVASPVVGALCDRLGPIRTICAGALIAGAAFVTASSWPHNFPVFVVAYGVLTAIALAAMTYVPMGILVDRLFEERNKGLAYALITNGTAIGFTVLSPLWIYLAPHVAWPTLFRAVGLIFLLPIAIALYFAGKTRLPAPAAEPALPASWAAVLRDPHFYVLALGFTSCGATMAFIDVHLVPFWEDAHVPRAVMGVSMSLLGALALASGVVAGWLASRTGKKQLLGGYYLLRALAVCLLLVPHPVVYTVIFAVVFGISYSGTVVLTYSYCFDLYGPKIKGQAFGALFFLHQLGAFAAVRWGGLSFDATHSYTALIHILIATTCIAGCASFLYLPSAARPKPQPI